MATAPVKIKESQWLTVAGIETTCQNLIFQFVLFCAELAAAVKEGVVFAKPHFRGLKAGGSRTLASLDSSAVRGCGGAARISHPALTVPLLAINTSGNLAGTKRQP